MRKPKSAYSKQAKKVLAVLEHLERGELPGYIYQTGDVSWSLAEAATIETPVGEVHLHWTNRRGHGRWNIIINPKWRGEICGTARCRRVTIIPHGGANESVPIKLPTLEQLGTDYWKAKWAKEFPNDPYPWSDPPVDERYLGEVTW